jgi:hypothetical protein
MSAVTSQYITAGVEANGTMANGTTANGTTTAAISVITITPSSVTPVVNIVNSPIRLCPDLSALAFEDALFLHQSRLRGCQSSLSLMVQVYIFKWCRLLLEKWIGFRLRLRQMKQSVIDAMYHVTATRHHHFTSDPGPFYRNLRDQPRSREGGTTSRR